MKFLQECSEGALSLERLAPDEQDPVLQKQLAEQAAAYWKLAARRAKQYGLPPTSLSGI